MKVIVFGATGGVGRHLVARTAGAGHEVTAFVRDASKVDAALAEQSNVNVFVGDALDSASVTAAIAGQDAVMIALASSGGLKKSDQLERMAGIIAPAMTAAGVQRIIVCASAGVDDELTGAIGKMVAFTLRHPLRDHRAALDIYRAAGLDLTVARPMGLTDDDFAQYRRSDAGVPDSGRSIPRESVADFMVGALTDSATIGASVGLAV